MISPGVQATDPSPVSPASATKATAAAHHGFSFHDFLSAINPLQYLPVVGTIYRAATGDIVPEPVRQAGSLLVSGLMGGPIGLITNIATTIAEKITGFDPDKMVTSWFHKEPIAIATGDETRTSAQAFAVAPVPAASTTLALSPEQLAAYGVRSDASGNLKLGQVEGAEVLNMLEQIRHGNAAAAAYAATMALPSKGV